MLSIMAYGSMGINVPASEFINKGLIKGEIKVEMLVSVIDNTTLALAKYANIRR